MDCVRVANCRPSLTTTRLYRSVELRAPPNQALHLTGAAILVSRASTSAQRPGVVVSQRLLKPTPFDRGSISAWFVSRRLCRRHARQLFDEPHPALPPAIG